MKIRNRNGFTLVEILIVLSILSILSIIFVQIFFRSLRGSSKAQILGIVKQNGQSALDSMDKSIRTADKIVCPSTNQVSDTLVLLKDADFIRFKFNAPKTAPLANGFISQDNERDCTSALALNYTSLTNTHITNGASVLSGSFLVNSKQGFSDLVAISFQIGPGISIPKTLTDIIDPIKMSTSVSLR